MVLPVASQPSKSRGAKHDWTIRGGGSSGGASQREAVEPGEAGWVGGGPAGELGRVLAVRFMDSGGAHRTPETGEPGVVEGDF
jgi:hypothetical protein